MRQPFKEGELVELKKPLDPRGIKWLFIVDEDELKTIKDYPELSKDKIWIKIRSVKNDIGALYPVSSIKRVKCEFSIGDWVKIKSYEEIKSTCSNYVYGNGDLVRSYRFMNQYRTCLFKKDQKKLCGLEGVISGVNIDGQFFVVIPGTEYEDSFNFKFIPAWLERIEKNGENRFNFRSN